MCFTRTVEWNMVEVRLDSRPLLPRVARDNRAAVCSYTRGRATLGRAANLKPPIAEYVPAPMTTPDHMSTCRISRRKFRRICTYEIVGIKVPLESTLTKYAGGVPSSDRFKLLDHRLSYLDSDLCSKSNGNSFRLIFLRKMLGARPLKSLFKL